MQTIQSDGSLTVEGGTEKCSSYFRWKSDEHPKSVRSCDEAGDFHDVTLAWNDDEFQCSH